MSHNPSKTRYKVEAWSKGCNQLIFEFDDFNLAYNKFNSLIADDFCDHVSVHDTLLRKICITWESDD